MNHRDFFYAFMKPVIIAKAVAGTLPSDLTQLEFDDLVPDNYEEDKDEAFWQTVSNLAEMVSLDDDMSYVGEYNKLLAQAEIDDSVMADDVVTMWEPIQFTLTVRQLLDAI